MGQKVRPRQKVQRAASARGRATTRVLGRRQPKRRRASAEVSRPVTYITVNRGVIDANRKHGTNQPPVRVAVGKYGKPRYGHAAFVLGASSFIYDSKNPLPHGARLWVETIAKVLVS